MLDKKIKDKIIKKYRTHPADTGSCEVQIAILTYEIETLANHLKTHKKDFSSRRGLIKKVSARRRLLRFLERDNPESFEKVIKDLKLRRPAKITSIADDIAEEVKVEIVEEADAEEEIEQEAV